MKSTLQHKFSDIPSVQIPRSVFDRSHGVKTTMDAGVLVPVFVDEALPGDTFQMSTSVFARLATPIVPIMDNMFMDFHYFAVPNRLLWDNWQKFCGERVDPGDSIDYTIPQQEAPVGGWLTGTQADYFGLPLEQEITASALPFRAYKLIFNEWYRDQNLQNSSDVATDDGPDTGNGPLKSRNKRHDYFTSCLPWPQKQENPVEIPLGDQAPVYGNGKGLGIEDGSSNASIRETANVIRSDINAYNLNVGTALGAANPLTGDVVLGVVQKPKQSGLYADLSTATAATINSLRQAFQIQKMLEKDARGGTRYVEVIKSHFGVTSPDFRLQRPEYLGGGTIKININPVQQTSQTDPAGTPQGNLAAYGLAAGKAGFSKSFTEHCTIMGIASVRADLTYQNCINRMWSRETRYDFYWPSFAHLGEQAVLNKELWSDTVDGKNNLVFGYQERWAEYRYKPSLVTGKMRSGVDSLDVWHLAQQFGGRPNLDSSFIKENPPLDRCVAVPSEPKFIVDMYHGLRCARPMPLYSVPGRIDHF